MYIETVEAPKGIQGAWFAEFRSIVAYIVATWTSAETLGPANIGSLL